MKKSWIRALGVTVLAVAAPVAAPAQTEGMVAKLVSDLGVTEAQAEGGVQAILATAKGRLSGADYAKLLDSAPDLGALGEMGGGESATGEMMKKAESMTGEAPDMTEEAAQAGEAGAEETEEGTASAMDGAMASVGAALGSAGGAMGGLDLSSLSKLSDLTKSFEGLGLDAGMVQKFVPVVLEQLGSGSASAGLLKKGLGLL